MLLGVSYVINISKLTYILTEFDWELVKFSLRRGKLLGSLMRSFVLVDIPSFSHIEIIKLNANEHAN